MIDTWGCLMYFQILFCKNKNVSLLRKMSAIINFSQKSPFLEYNLKKFSDPGYTSLCDFNKLSKKKKKQMLVFLRDEV